MVFCVTILQIIAYSLIYIQTSMGYPIRINKYIRELGLASRREADKLVEAGFVIVNGQPASPGTIVNARDIVTIKKGHEKKMVYLAYYKPRGTSTQDENYDTSVIGVWAEKGLFPIGRLDKESEGLLILTNDGRLTSKITDPESRLEKEYIVRVKEKIREGIPAILEKGMDTAAFGRLLPAKAKIIDDHNISITLHEGKRHQIRVMLAELGLMVSALKRIRIGHVGLGNLRPSQTRELTEKEIAGFFDK